MDTFLGRYKNLIVLAAILFAQIIALAVQVRRPTDEGETRLVRLWAISAVTPFEKAAVHSQEWVHNVWNTYIYLHGVRRENRELKDQIAQMKIEEARLAEDARMARRVQALLGFKEQYVDSTVAAQVIGTSGSEQSRVLYIDKGSSDGIQPDMAVITPTGIVGKIAQVYPDSAQVLPINDQFSGVGAALKDSRLQGILKGAANGATTLQYIMSDEKVVPGEEVVTSGGDRIFPKGLPVGKVVSVEPGKDLFLNIRVVPSSRLDQLEEVLVVTRITEKMPDTKDLGPLRASDILAERLPSVPKKDEVDAAGNPVKPGTPGAVPSGAAAGSTTKPATNGTLAKPGTAAATATTKPGTAAATGTAKSATGTATSKLATGTTTPRSTTPGATAGTPIVAKPKPVTTTGTSTTGTTAAPANGDTTRPPVKIRIVDNGDTSAPAPKKAKPVQPAPSDTSDEPAPATQGASPQP